MQDGQGAVLIMFYTAVLTPEVFAVIQQQFGENPYSSRRKERDDRRVYEVDAWIKDRHIELNLFADGTLRNRYEAMTFAELPSEVRLAEDGTLPNVETD